MMSGQKAINGEGCEKREGSKASNNVIPHAPFSLNPYFYILSQLRKRK